MLVEFSFGIVAKIIVVMGIPKSGSGAFCLSEKF